MEPRPGYIQGMKVKKLLHTRYRVNDLARTIQFYKDVLGLEETRRSKSPRGSELVFLKAPDSDELIEICCFPASGPFRCSRISRTWPSPWTAWRVSPAIWALSA
jgi:hypothetical protein